MPEDFIGKHIMSNATFSSICPGGLDFAGKQNLRLPYAHVDHVAISGHICQVALAMSLAIFVFQTLSGTFHHLNRRLTPCHLQTESHSPAKELTVSIFTAMQVNTYVPCNLCTHLLKTVPSGSNQQLKPSLSGPETHGPADHQFRTYPLWILHTIAPPAISHHYQALSHYSRVANLSWCEISWHRKASFHAWIWALKAQVVSALS